jgi:hypothetical protein
MKCLVHLQLMNAIQTNPILLVNQWRHGFITPIPDINVSSFDNHSHVRHQRWPDLFPDFRITNAIVMGVSEQWAFISAQLTNEQWYDKP